MSIPIIYLEDGTAVPVDKSELPIELPEDINLNSPGNPLEFHPTWKITTQRSTGKKATRETDTLDTFVTHLGFPFVHQVLKKTFWWKN